MKAIKSLLVVFGFGLLSATASAQNPETGALMTDPSVGCAYGYGQYGYMNCGGGSSASARPQPPKFYERYGAVAINLKTFDFASTYVGYTREDAERSALGMCGVGCEILETYTNKCIALAIGPFQNRKTSAIATSQNSKRADSNALAECSKKSKGCKIVLSECALNLK